MTPSEELECPECQATIAVASKFCENCGLRLTQPQASAGRSTAKPASRRPAKELHKSERREIERAVARARSKLKSVRVLFIIFAALSAVIMALTYGQGSAGLEVDPGVFDTVLIIQGAMVLLLACAALFLYDQPLFWVVTVASVFTVSSILSISILGIIISISLWCALPVILNVTRLRREHPELLTKDNLVRRKTASLSEESTARVEALAKARKRQAIRSFVTVAGIVVLAGVGIIWANLAIRSGSRGESRSNTSDLSAAESSQRTVAFGEARRAFEEAWAASDYPGVESLGSKEYLDERSARVQDILRERGWTKHFPPITFESVPSESDDRRELWFSVTPRGRLKTRWVFEDGAWKVRIIVFSRTR